MDVAAIPDPLVATHRQLGERVVDTRNLLTRLESLLAHIDELRERLREEHIHVDIDLGEVGNAAAEARRKVGQPGHPTFELPRAS